MGLVTSQFTTKEIYTGNFKSEIYRIADFVPVGTATKESRTTVFGNFYIEILDSRTARLTLTYRGEYRKDEIYEVLMEYTRSPRGLVARNSKLGSIDDQYFLLEITYSIATTKIDPITRKKSTVSQYTGILTCVNPSDYCELEGEKKIFREELDPWDDRIVRF